MKIFEIWRDHEHKVAQDRIKTVGDKIAHTIHHQILAGHTSPYKVEVKNPLRKQMENEMFLLRCSDIAVRKLGTVCIGEELPLYDESATLLENQEDIKKPKAQITMIFTRPSEMCHL